MNADWTRKRAGRTPNLKRRIEEAFQPALGMPLWRSSRAADMECFQFGAQRPVRTRRGEPALIGEFALHVQCAWRLAGPGGIITGRQDLYYPPGDSGLSPEDFDWDENESRRDGRLRGFFQEHASEPPVLMKVQGDFLGGARLLLSGGLTLELFPANSLPGEHWRLFRSGTDGPHFVVTGRGLET